MSHEFDIVSVKDATDVWHAGWAAHCECGWWGDLHERGETCLRDGFDHQRASTPTPKD